MKIPEKVTITTIIHDLKTQYSRVFKEKFPSEDSQLEKALNQAAKEAKQGKIVNWYLDSEGLKRIKIEQPKRRRFF